jgi:O-antigen ligase
MRLTVAGTEPGLAGLCVRGREAGLLVLAFILPFAHTAAIRSIALGLGVGLVLLERLVQRDWRWRPTPLDWPIACQVAWTLAVLPWALYPRYSAGQVLRQMVPYFAAYYLTVLTVTDAGKARRLVVVLLAASACMAAGGILEAARPEFWAADRNQEAGRLKALTSDYNFLATYLATVWAVPLTLAWTERERWTRAASWAVLAVNGGLLYFTYTRAAWLAAGVSGLLVTVALRRRRALLVLAVAAGLLLLVAPTQVLVRGGADGGRFTLWRLGVEAVARHPVTGVGYGRDAVSRSVSDWPRVDGTNRPGHPHNMFVATAMELGVPGAAILVWLLASAGMVLARGARRAGPGPQRAAILIALAAFLGFLVRNQFDHIYHYGPAQLFWLLVGLGVAAQRWPVGQPARPGPGGGPG